MQLTAVRLNTEFESEFEIELQILLSLHVFCVWSISLLFYVTLYMFMKLA